MGETIIRAENLSFSYESEEEKIPVIENLNLEIEKGSFVAVLGHNGSGKSTLAKLINLILTPTAGSLYLFGKKVDEKEMNEDELYALRQRIGMVFQNPDNQLVATIVEEDIAFGPENLGIPPAEIRKRVDDALEIVGMSAFARHSPHQLSGGMLQRIMIGIATSMKPSLLIADEPTTAIDAITQFEILDELLRIKQEHQTAMVFISHDLNAISRVADRIVVLNQGLVVDQGDFQHILHHATDSYTKLLVEKRTDVMRRYSQVLGGKERVYA